MVRCSVVRQLLYSQESKPKAIQKEKWACLRSQQILDIVFRILPHTEEKSIPSIAVEDSADILRESLENDYEEVFIDEIQFFDDAIVDVIEKLLNQGRRVTVAGLDQDFAGRGFGKIPELLARAEIITKLTAICTICGGAATKSQRLINGKPAKINDDIMVLGAAESYEARCRVHHVVPE